MTLPPGSIEALARAASIAVLLCWLSRPAVDAAMRWPFVRVLLALPLLTPSVAVGYAWLHRLVPGWQPEVVYALVLAARLLPVAALVEFVLPPPPASDRTRHIGRLGGTTVPGAWLRGRFRNRAIVASAVFLLAFQEFDLATLCTARSWTVWLFDAQAGGFPLGSTLGAAAGPLLIELAVLGGAVALFLRTRAGVGHEDKSSRCAGIGMATATLSALLISGWPLVALAPGAAEVRHQFQLLGEIGHSTLLAAGATVCALAVSRLFPTPVVVAACIPGLLGGLPLALTLQYLFQTPALAALYDTPVPLLLAWTVLLLPLALLLRLALTRATPGASVHAAGLLAGSREPDRARRGRDLRFALQARSEGLAFVVLFALAFFEVVAGDILAPSHMAPAASRLYNLMHYGQSGGLAAMVLLLTLALLALSAGAFSLWRLAQRWRSVPIPGGSG